MRPENSLVYSPTFAVDECSHHRLLPVLEIVTSYVYVHLTWWRLLMRDMIDRGFRPCYRPIGLVLTLGGFNAAIIC